MEQKMPGGYIPRFPVSAPEPNSLTARLRDAHANVIAIRREFLERKGSASGSLTSLGDELSRRITHECLPAVHAGQERIAQLAAKAPSPEVSNELEELAGRRNWDGGRDPLTSPVEVTGSAIELTLEWLRKERAVRS